MNTCAIFVGSSSYCAINPDLDVANPMTISSSLASAKLGAPTAPAIAVANDMSRSHFVLLMSVPPLAMWLASFCRETHVTAEKWEFISRVFAFYFS
jgi:hypothetical protein